MIDDGTGLLTIAGLTARAAAQARQRGTAPESPEAEPVPREPLGNADPADVLERLRSTTNDKVARYRELPGVVTATERWRRTGRSSRGWSLHWRRGPPVNLTSVNETASTE
ncbi:hypothetical protein [Streptomyces resistomycificus]|uniref:Uncharacterized protein n=1 Tax=Streptomyces resistomycificus TaxID=67356 RepID=A0A0L8KV28_9ACTN|nr:hypothetical protein [Streptomyces resistomycificus]KOG29604.1 hypothetical protein ADK37_36170 [Streptomyces resistomycificus]KUN90434.1 hypothetical protein AQJ84_40025 [Streptomyces resistomycificus]